MQSHENYMGNLRNVMTMRNSVMRSRDIVEDFIPFEELDVDSVVVMKQKIKQRFNVKTQHK